MNLYQQELMDHFRHPRNRGVLEHPSFSTDVFNPSCGDSVAFQGKITGGKIAEIAFTGKGCVISQATASLLSEKVKGMTVHEVMKLDKNYILALIGTELGPTRLRCALLPLEALQKGMEKRP